MYPTSARRRRREPDDARRGLLLDRLRERDGQTLRELCAGLGPTRQAVTTHLAVGDTIAGMVSQGWPLIVAELKTLLETTGR